MGVVLDCKCGKCGFEVKELYLGSGFADFSDSECGVPVPCYHCGKVFTIDFKKTEKLKCPTCRRKVEPFGEVVPESRKIYYTKFVFVWKVFDSKNFEPDRIYILKDRKYKCPKCMEDKLEFGKGNMSLWD